MALERDRNLAQLVSMGYQPHEASAALEESKNNLEGAIDRLISHHTGNSLNIQRGGISRGGRGPPTSDRGRGGRGGGRGIARGGRFDSVLDEDPRFDPVCGLFYDAPPHPLNLTDLSF